MTNAIYRESWERYWTDVSEPGAPLWDSDPNEAVLADLPRFLPHLDASLPLLDVGCGNGTQSPALARHFARVIGVDVSPAGVALCQAHHAAPGLEFRVLDLLDADAVAALHAELGDMNLYVRTVIHQLGDADRQPAIANLATLLGARGRAFVFELSHAAESYFSYLFTEFGGPPPKLDRVLGSGIRPGNMPNPDIREALLRMFRDPNLLHVAVFTAGDPVKVLAATLVIGQVVPAGKFVTFDHWPTALQACRDALTA